MFWPIVECGGVEVSSARPYDRMYLRIERDLSKSNRVAQGAIKLAFKNRPQINGPAQAIVETQAQRIGLDALDRCDAVNRMIHGADLLQWRDWGRLAALLKKLPARKQLLPVKLGPSLDKTQLPLWNEGDDERHRRNRKDGNMLAIVGVEMRDVMALRRLGEHPNDDAVKA